MTTSCSRVLHREVCVWSVRVFVSCVGVNCPLCKYIQSVCHKVTALHIFKKYQNGEERNAGKGALKL